MTASTSLDHATSKLNSLSKQFAKDNNISEERAGSVLGDFGVRAAAGFLSGGAQITMSGNGHDTELYRKAKYFTSNQEWREALSSAEQAAHDVRSHTGNDMSTQKGKEWSESLEKANQYRTEAAQHMNQAHDYSNQLSYLETHSNTVNANLTDKFIDFTQKKHDFHSRGDAARWIQENPLIAVYEAKNEFLKTGEIQKEVRSHMPKAHAAPLTNTTKATVNPSNFDAITLDKPSMDPTISREVHDKISVNKAAIMSQTQDIRLQGEAEKEHTLQELNKGVMRKTASATNKGLNPFADWSVTDD